MNKGLLQQLLDGRLSFKDLENLTDASSAKEIRNQFLSKQTGMQLANLGSINFDADVVRNRNIENLIGSVEVPVGVAGPVRVKGQAAAGEYFLPMATTEGALVASTSRGVKLINLNGGAKVSHNYVGITRAPMFRLESVSEHEAVRVWIKKQLPKLNKLATSSSAHLKLKNITPYFLGRELWLRMQFDTDEAMGMNMATKASRIIAEKFTHDFSTAKLVALSGNLCTDKKASLLNLIMGRGHQVYAEVTLSRSDVEKYLHTTPEAITAVNVEKVWHGSGLAGSNSFNSHFANVIAAIFLATGQHMAHVVDSSQGYTVMEVDDGDLYASVSIPSLILGYIGGGTCLPKQAQAKELILTDVSAKKRTNSARKSSILAEITAAAVLAGEISLHAALAADELVSAHEKLGKGRK